MTDVAISNLPASISINTADLIPIVQGGTTKKATGAMVVTTSQINANSGVAGIASDGALAGTKIYDVENFGASPSASESANTTAIQNALNAANASGGGLVRLTKPGTYAVDPILRVYSNTHILLGNGVILQNGTPSRTGILFGTTYNGLTFTGSTAGASNTITVGGGSTAGMAGACLCIYNGTPRGANGTPAANNWIAGTYYVVSSTATTITLDRACSTGNGSGLVACLGFAMFRDGSFEAASPIRSFGITIDGGTIDMNNSTAPDPEGYFTYALWFRQSDRMRVANIGLINCRIYATMLEDVNDSTFDNIYFNTRRDGLHFFGPNNNIVVRDTHGTTTDNMIALCAGAATAPGEYPLDSLPYGGAYSGGSMSNFEIKNTVATASYNPVRIVGNSSVTANNIHIDGVHGSLWSGSVADGRWAVTMLDDVADYVGMVASNVVIENVDMTCIATTTGDSGLVHVTMSSAKDVAIKNCQVSGSWSGVNVFSTVAGGMNCIVLDGITASSGIANIGTNNLIYLNTSYNLQNLIIRNVRLPATSAPGSATAGLNFNTLAGVPFIMLENIYMSYYGLSFTAAASSATYVVNVDHAILTNATPQITVTSGAPTFNFANTVVGWQSGRWFNFAKGANSGTLFVKGAVDFHETSTDYPAISLTGAGAGSLRVDGLGIQAYASDVTAPVAGDLLHDITTGLPQVYKSGAWSSL